MSTTEIDQVTIAQTLMLLEEEREKALSPREWQHRIAGYGYAIKRTDHGEMVTTLPHGQEVCALPVQLSA